MEILQFGQNRQCKVGGKKAMVSGEIRATEKKLSTLHGDNSKYALRSSYPL
jgi:hypothetical protein